MTTIKDMKTLHPVAKAHRGADLATVTVELNPAQLVNVNAPEGLARI